LQPAVWGHRSEFLRLQQSHEQIPEQEDANDDQHGVFDHLSLFEPFASAKINNRGNEEGQCHQREQQIRHSAPHWVQSGSKASVVRQALQSNEVFVRIL
jgi:hypothetical protein